MTPQVLASLMNLVSRLSLAHTNVTDQGAAAIAEAIAAPHNRLRQLEYVTGSDHEVSCGTDSVFRFSLGNNQIQAAGAVALAKSIPSSHLVWLRCV